MSQSAKSTPPQEGANLRPRHGWARGLSETALGEARTAFARAGFADATLLLRWVEIAGPHIARIARPAKWQDGPEGATLTLKCEAGAAVLLQHQTRELIQRLNAYLGAGRVSKLKLVPGRLAHLSEPPNHPAPMADSTDAALPLTDALARLAQARVRLDPPRPKRVAKAAVKAPD